MKRVLGLNGGQSSLEDVFIAGRVDIERDHEGEKRGLRSVQIVGTSACAISEKGRPKHSGERLTIGNEAVTFNLAHKIDKRVASDAVDAAFEETLQDPVPQSIQARTVESKRTSSCPCMCGISGPATS